MRLLERRDFRVVLQRQANFVESFQQDVFSEFIDLEAAAYTVRVGHGLRGQIDGQGIALLTICTLK
jgi:hypothetical protein